ncbi:3'-5' exonuclease [Streptomyces zagrosensis]|uniref:DNA polymerase III epsilon subunit-like protein n=1 Tax=Streptomyces zagrosensis TaxID=1042984 RepID=A0A7W9UXQ2_9ACTN|nr:3'-5' exonuclease [Streptomyces zagrosensis]MBB5935148.1 DNA polymerase III epsilon subunit-like protein [Streptomyces zagrosensis]
MSRGNGTNPPDLVEVAALPMIEGQPDTATAGAWLIKPKRPVTPFAARVHGLTNQALEDKPGWEETKGAVHDLLGTAWVVAHNAHVDYRVLSAHLPQWQPAGVIDTLRLAKATYPDLSKYSLDALIEHVEPDLRQAPGQRHRATFDAYATAQLLITMADRYESWEQLVTAAVPPGTPEPEQEPTLW